MTVRALCRISFDDCRGEPCRALFRLYHMHHAVVIMSSSTSWPTCCLKMWYHSILWTILRVEKKNGQLTYFLKFKKKNSHKTPHLVMNVENVVMLCKAWNLTNAYHLIAFYYYINQLELQSYSQKTKFIY